MQMTGELPYPNSFYVPAISPLTARRVHLEAAYHTLHIICILVFTSACVYRILLLLLLLMNYFKS